MAPLQRWAAAVSCRLSAAGRARERPGRDLRAALETEGHLVERYTPAVLLSVVVESTSAAHSVA